MDNNWAAQHLQTIRTLMERSALYRRALAPIFTFVGAIGILAAVGGSAMPLSPRGGIRDLLDDNRRHCRWRRVAAGAAAGIEAGRSVLVTAGTPCGAGYCAAATGRIRSWLLRHRGELAYALWDRRHRFVRPTADYHNLDNPLRVGSARGGLFYTTRKYVFFHGRFYYWV